MYEKFFVALQERCTSYHITQFYRLSLPVYFVNLIKHRRRILSSYQFSRSENSHIYREFNAVKRAQWLEFCLGLEPKNTHCFWNHCNNVFKKRALVIQGFRDGTTDRVLTDPNFMIEHAHRYYSQAFQESETASQHQDAAELIRTLAERLAELSSQPFLFKITDLHRSIHRLKTKTSSGHEKVSNKLLKSIPICHYGFLLQIFNDLLVKNTYLEQSGFPEKHSTTTRFVQFLQHISSGLLQQTATLVIYIDFIKAFDQLWHDDLIYKLHK